MTTEIHNQIDKAFSEFVDDEQAPDLTKYFLELAEDSKFDKKEINKKFSEYLSKMDPDEDMLKEMTDKGMEVLDDIIMKNKATLFPHLEPVKTKLKMKDISKNEKPKTKLGMGKITKKETLTPEEEPAKESDDDSGSSDSKKSSGKKTSKGPTRASGYTLFLHDMKKKIEAELEEEWNKKYPDAPYTKNNVEVSKEIGRRWREDTPKEEVDRYNAKAAEQNKANNIEPRGKSKVPESEKKPLTGFSMFHKVKKEEVLADYRKKNKMSEDEKIKPTDAMAIVSRAWGEYKKDPDNKAEMDRLAAEYNEEHGRKHTPKKKSEKSNDKKTTAYLEFCKNFRDEYRKDHDREDPDFDVYAESREMNKEWKKIKDDDEKHDAWKTIAHDENVKRGLVEEDAE